MGHPWKSTGEWRTIVCSYEPSAEVLHYLREMQDAMRYSLQVGYRDAVMAHGRIPSPIQLRREVREWFYSRYDYARHHTNPVCRRVVAMLHSYRKSHRGELRIPEVKRLAMRLDGMLFKIVGDRVRVTLRPNEYVWLPLNTRNKDYPSHSEGRPSELLITDRKVCITFVVNEVSKPLGQRLQASDLNFRSLDMTAATKEPTRMLMGAKTEPWTG